MKKYFVRLVKECESCPAYMGVYKQNYRFNDYSVAIYPLNIILAIAFSLGSFIRTAWLPIALGRRSAYLQGKREARESIEQMKTAQNAEALAALEWFIDNCAPDYNVEPVTLICQQADKIRLVINEKPWWC